MKQPIGYQVADSQGEYPEGMWSFEIHPLEKCLAEVAKDKKRWRLLPIWKGDIEKPAVFDKNGKGIVLM